jgi:hypothetical protein
MLINVKIGSTMGSIASRIKMIASAGIPKANGTILIIVLVTGLGAPDAAIAAGTELMMT